MPHLFTRITLIVAALGVAQIAPSLAGSDVAVAAKKKKKPKKVKKAPAPKKMGAQLILHMKKDGLTDDEIVARVNEAGYKLTAKDRAALKKKAPKLLAAIDPTATEAPVAETKKPIDINKITDPNDIDFDEVPPPSGMPRQYKDKQATEATQPKKLDHSTRPSAPFDETTKQQPQQQASQASQASASKPAAAPQKPQVAAASSPPQQPGRRVVFTPGQ